MLSVMENERLTKVGPGAPMGELMRRYWHPIAPTRELDENPTREVRLLGEDLVLYKDRSGRYGLVGRYCAHRRVNLAYGIPEERGLRCMYHGWLYDETGQCVEQPFEETVRPESRFRDKIKLPGYRVEELSGLLWAYMGPEPAPLLPRWSALAEENAVKDIAITHLPANWLQCMENSLDPVHVEWLHTHLTEYLKERRGSYVRTAFPTRRRAHLKIGFDVFPYGVIKRRLVEGDTEESDDWKVGHPILFPNILYIPGMEVMRSFEWRVPIDDENTFHVSMYIHVPAPGHRAPAQDYVPYRYVPLYDDAGWLQIERSVDQDKAAMVAQGPGPVVERDLERLGSSDTGLVLFRKLLNEQMDIVMDGGEPMAVIRDPEQNVSIDLPTEREYLGLEGGKHMSAKYFDAEAGENPARPLIDQVLATWRGD